MTPDEAWAKAEAAYNACADRLGFTRSWRALHFEERWQWRNEVDPPAPSAKAYDSHGISAVG